MTIRISAPNSIDAECLLSTVARRIQNEEPTTIHRSERGIEFTVNEFRFVQSNNLLIPFRRGQIVYDKCTASVQMSLSLAHGLWMVAAIPSITFAYWSLKTGDPRLLWLAPLGIGWLVGGNVIIGRIRFIRLVNEAVLQCNRQSGAVYTDA